MVKHEHTRYGQDPTRRRTGQAFDVFFGDEAIDIRLAASKEALKLRRKLERIAAKQARPSLPERLSESDNRLARASVAVGRTIGKALAPGLFDMDPDEYRRQTQLLGDLLNKQDRLRHLESLKGLGQEKSVRISAESYVLLPKDLPDIPPLTDSTDKRVAKWDLFSLLHSIQETTPDDTLYSPIPDHINPARIVKKTLDIAYDGQSLANTLECLMPSLTDIETHQASALTVSPDQKAGLVGGLAGVAEVYLQRKFGQVQSQHINNGVSGIDIHLWEAQVDSTPLLSLDRLAAINQPPSQ